MKRNEKVMYPMRPLITLPPILPPEVMYKMQNIHEKKFLNINQRLRRLKVIKDLREITGTRMIGENITEKVIRILKGPLPEYQDVEIKQENVLIQLADLKQRVSKLCQFLKQSSGIGFKSNKNDKVETVTDYMPSYKQEPLCTFRDFLNEPIIFEIVVYANPDYPPFSILALQKLWNDVDIRVTSYKHSSLTEQDSSSVQLVLPFQKNKNYAVTTVINLSLIWKNTDELEVVIDLNEYNIFGESNLLRYLSRLIKAHNYEDMQNIRQTNLLDVILDWCFVTYNQLKKGAYEQMDFSAATCYLNKYSNKPEEFNIADIAIWALIKQFPLEKKPKILDQWFELCEKTFIDE